MSLGKLFFEVGLILCMSAASSGQNVLLPKDLDTFMRTFRVFSRTVNDVVFVLDESGSIGEDIFQDVKAFTKLIAQFLTVSEDQSRVAVITFSTSFRIPINYIENPYRKNMCTLLEQIDNLGYAGMLTETDLAMEEAGKILTRGRPHTKK